MTSPVRRRVGRKRLMWGVGALLLAACSSSKPDPESTRTDTETSTDATSLGGTQSTDSGQELVSKPPGPGWGESQRVGDRISKFGLEMGRPVAALNEKGQAIIAWDSAPKNSSARYSVVYAAVYKNNAWQPPFMVCAEGVPCQDPSVAINDRGDLAISYERIVNNSEETMHSTELWVKTAAQWDWKDAVRVSRAEPKGLGNYVDESLIALDEAGRALAMWKETDTHGGSAIRLQSAHFDGSAWGAPTRMDQRLPSHVDAFAFAWNAKGQGMAVWLDATNAFDPSKPNEGEVKAMTWARPIAEGQWGSPRRLIDDPENKDFVACTGPRVGVDVQGNAVVAFTRKSAAPQFSVMTRRFSRSSQQWGPARAGVPARTQPFLKASLDVNNKGDAALAWYGDDPSNDEHQVVHYRFLASGAAEWGATVHMNEKGSAIESDPVVGLNGDGHAWVSWRQPSAYYPDEVRTRMIYGPEERLGPESQGTSGTTLGMLTNDAGQVLVYGLRTVAEHSPSVGYYEFPWARMRQPE